jgi:hypothetical protein
MRALLTSSGIRNSSIRDALVDLLGKPIALVIPPASTPSPAGRVWRGERSPARVHRLRHAQGDLKRILVTGQVRAWSTSR